MEERLTLLEELVDGQQKVIEDLFELVTLLDKRLDNANNRIALLKQFAESNTDMIKSSNDTMKKLFELIKKD